MVSHHIARARYVEVRLDELLEAGLEQYVLLGAGMDSFAFRRKDVAEFAAPGSEIVFDTLDRATFTTGRDAVAARKMFKATEKMSEPMISGFDPPDLSRLLARAGFEMVEVVTPRAFARLWFEGRSDLPTPWEHMYMVRARVGWRLEQA